MSEEVATKESKPAPVSTAITKLQNYLVENTDRIAKFCGDALKPDRMIRLVLKDAVTNGQLAQCSHQSVMLALCSAAHLGLEPSGITGQAYLVPFKDKSGSLNATLVIGYQGWMDLVRRALPQGVDFYAEAVYEGDEFDVVMGTKREIIHKPGAKRDYQKLVAAYAVAVVGSERVSFAVMYRAEIDAVRASAPSKNSPAWGNWFGEMAKKTVIKRLCKTMPHTPLLAAAIAADDNADSGAAIDVSWREAPDGPKDRLREAVK